jgi:hypothetical protein
MALMLSVYDRLSARVIPPARPGRPRSIPPGALEEP